MAIDTDGDTALPALSLDVREFGPWQHRGDVTATLQTALAAVAQMDPAGDAGSRGTEIRLPYGTGCVAAPLLVGRCVHLRGLGGHGDYQPTALEFAPGVSGIVLCGPQDGGGRADGSVIESVRLISAGGPAFGGDPLDPLPGEGGHGVEVRCPRVELSRVTAEGFLDGIHISSADSLPNCNEFALDRVLSVRNRRHGLFASGTNSNAGNVTRCSFNNNAHHGVCDRSFLGNNYTGCHFMENGLGAVWCGNLPGFGSVNRSVFVGNYSERGGRPSHLEHPALWVGGNEHFDAVSSPALVDPGYYGLVGLPVRSQVLRPLERLVRPDTGAPGTPWPCAPGTDGCVVDTAAGLAVVILPDPSGEPDGAELTLQCEGQGGLWVSVLNGGRRVWDAGRYREGLELSDGHTATLRACQGLWRVVGRC